MTVWEIFMEAEEEEEHVRLRLYIQPREQLRRRVPSLLVSVAPSAALSIVVPTQLARERTTFQHSLRASSSVPISLRIVKNSSSFHSFSSFPSRRFSYLFEKESTRSLFKTQLWDFFKTPFLSFALQTGNGQVN